MNRTNKSSIDYMVCVKCATFNHASYIEDTMNGFCMQQTNFPFVCVIVDDASTDGEQEVISNYLQAHFDLEDKSIVIKEENDDYFLTFARHNTNSNCFFAVYYLKYNHYSIKKSKKSYIYHWQNNAKYIALCEGDDYWIAPQKMQRQVDVLEKNPECTIVFNRVKVISKDYQYLDWDIPRKGHIQDGFIELKDYTYEEYNRGFWTFHTSSYFFKSDLVDGFSDILTHEFKNFPYGDMPLLLFCLIKGKGYFISETMGCYRYLSGGYNSTIANNKSYSISQEEKLIQALKDLDEFTLMKYHNDIHKKVTRSKFNTEIIKGNYKRLFNKDLRSELNKYPLKSRLYFFMRGYTPHLFSLFFKIKNSF